jgi:5'-nucleotidase
MRIKTAMAIAIAIAIVIAAGCGDNQGDRERLVVLHTNDEHSHLFGWSPEIDDYPLPAAPGNGEIVGSIARRASVLRVERAAAAAAGADVVLVSAGDETQGALPQLAFTTTSPDFALMNRLGYDVMTPGNHEFDLGPAAFAESIDAAMSVGGSPQWVSTNIRFDDADPGDDTLAALFGEGDSLQPIKRYHVIETESGIRVGFVGVLGVNAALVAPLKAPVQFSGDLDDEGDPNAILPALFADLQPVVDSLRTDEGADVVIVVSHGGVDIVDPTRGDDFQIAANVTGIDLVVSGHSHTALDEPQLVDNPDGIQVPVVQAGFYGQYVGRVELEVGGGERPTLASTELIPVDNTLVADDPEIVEILDGVIRELEAGPLPAILSRIEGEAVTDDPETLGDLYHRTLCQTDFDIDGLSSFVETNAINLSTDAMLTVAEAEAGPTLVAVQAAGSVRASILAGATGALSFADLFRVLPLGDDPIDGSAGYPLSRFHILAIELKAAFEIAVSQGLIDSGFFLVGSGIRVEYDVERSPQVLGADLLNDALDPQNGRILRILVDADHSDGFDNPTEALFDIDRTGAEWDSALGDALTLHPVVTSSYVASFAEIAGVTLKSALGAPVDLSDTILQRAADGSTIKDFEAFMGYIVSECEANGGQMPDRYNAATAAGQTPRRLMCVGSGC